MILPARPRGAAATVKRARSRPRSSVGPSSRPCPDLPMLPLRLRRSGPAPEAPPWSRTTPCRERGRRAQIICAGAPSTGFPRQRSAALSPSLSLPLPSPLALAGTGALSWPPRPALRSRNVHSATSANLAAAAAAAAAAVAAAVAAAGVCEGARNGKPRSWAGGADKRCTIHAASPFPPRPSFPTLALPPTHRSVAQRTGRFSSSSCCCCCCCGGGGGGGGGKAGGGVGGGKVRGRVGGGGGGE